MIIMHGRWFSSPCALLGINYASSETQRTSVVSPKRSDREDSVQSPAGPLSLLSAIVSRHHQ